MYIESFKEAFYQYFFCGGFTLDCFLNCRKVLSQVNPPQRFLNPTPNIKNKSLVYSCNELKQLCDVRI